ncbi:hypothetical protein [Draconibacterium sediminis]|uniref:Uncharacterized protein n=1 Tax=Draconibacterium sediminis TaxID=1544798 RepID=A0A0D8JBD2_9BACT|nr:hypothetical protein [Draconibacterium sediminis]KJF44049.1 hypothetical protein LH29_00470 [Draconibacterium sediminis]
MVNKKQLPLKLCRDIEEIYSDIRKVAVAKQNIIVIEKEEDLHIKIIDNDPNSDFFLSILNPKFNRKSIFEMKWKPMNSISLDTHTTKVDKENVIKYFVTWIDTIEAYNSVYLSPDEKILKQYETEFFDSFEIIDEDADYNSFDFERQLIIQKFLESTLKILEEHPSDTKLIEEEVNDLKKNIPNLTKKVIVRRISKILALARKHSLNMCKAIYIEVKKQLISRAVTGGLDFIFDSISNL